MRNYIFSLLLSLFLFGCVSNNSGGFDPNTKEKLLLSGKNYQKLISFYKEQLVKKEDKDIRIKLIQAYVELGDFNSAIFYLEPLLKRQEIEYKVNLLAGKSYLNTGDIDRALEYLGKANQQQPTSAEVLNLLGISDCYKGNFYAAKQRFSQARIYMDDDLTVKNNLALVAILQQHYFTAKDLLESLYYTGAKNDRRVKANLAIVYAKLGNRRAFSELTKGLTDEQQNQVFARLKNMEVADVKGIVLGEHHEKSSK